MDNRMNVIRKEGRVGTKTMTGKIGSDQWIETSGKMDEWMNIWTNG